MRLSFLPKKKNTVCDISQREEADIHLRFVATYTYTTTWCPRWLTQEPVFELKGTFGKVLSSIFILKGVLIKIFLQQAETLIYGVKFHKITPQASLRTIT